MKAINFVGKVLIVLILLMSVAFLIIAVIVGAANQNWVQAAKDNAQEVRNLRAQAQQAIEEASKKDELLARERLMRTLQLQQLQSQYLLAQSNYEEANQSFQDVMQISKQAQERSEQFKLQISRLDGENKKLLDQNKLLIEDIATQRAKAAEYVNQIYELRNNLMQIEKIKQSLVDDVTTYSAILKKNGLTENDLTDDIPPKLEGLVSSVSEKYVVVGLGTDDGLREGHNVDILRRGKFLGSATITDARNNKSVARLIPEMTKAPIREGDSVTTEWSRASTGGQ